MSRLYNRVKSLPIPSTGYIQELLSKVDRFEELKFDSKKNAKKLNKLYQAGHIDIEGNIIIRKDGKQDM